MPNMLNIFSPLFLAQAAFGLVIINNYSTTPKVYDLALDGQEIHPNFNPNKCLDVQGGVFADNTPVQIFDCNGTPAQHWFMHDGSTTVQLAGTNFCLDAGSNPANGVALKIFTCFNGLPAQQWFYTGDFRIALEGQGFCADLTDGDLGNGNSVQIFGCTDGDVNQIWSTNFAARKKSSFSFNTPETQVILA